MSRRKSRRRSRKNSRSKSRSRFWLIEISDHLAVLKPRLMIDIIIWSWQDMCKEQGNRSRNRNKKRSRSRNRSRSKSWSWFWLNEMSDHLAVLKPRLMIDIIIWSWRDMCKEQGKRSRNKRRSRSRNRSRSKSRSWFWLNEMSDHLAVLKPRLMIDIIIWYWENMCKEQGGKQEKEQDKEHYGDLWWKGKSFA